MLLPSNHRRMVSLNEVPVPIMSMSPKMYIDTNYVSGMSRNTAGIATVSSKKGKKKTKVSCTQSREKLQMPKNKPAVTPNTKTKIVMNKTLPSKGLFKQ